MNKQPKKFSPLQIIVHASAWLLITWLLFDFFAGNLTINPIQAATQRTGRYAIAFLVLSLACTPANTLFGFRQAIRVRRSLGLYAFMFASVHFLLFSGIDYRFDWSLLISETLTKPYIYVGLSTLIILLLLAITSFRWWMKKLGIGWKWLHRLVYLAGILVVIHYSWAVKGDVLSLSGDIIKPLLYGVAVSALLIIRIPTVRKHASSLRDQLRAKRLKLSSKKKSNSKVEKPEILQNQ